MARKDYSWADRTLRRTLALTLVIGGVAAIGLLFLGREVIKLWVGTKFVPSTVLLGGFSAWLLLASYGGTVTVFLNSGPWLKKQVLFYAIASIISFGLKLYLVGPWKEAGVIWATVFGYSNLFPLAGNPPHQKHLCRPAPQRAGRCNRFRPEASCSVNVAVLQLFNYRS